MYISFPVIALHNNFQIVRGTMMFFSPTTVTPYSWQHQVAVLTHSGQIHWLAPQTFPHSTQQPIESMSNKVETTPTQVQISRHDRSAPNIISHTPQKPKFRKRKVIGSESEGEEFEVKREDRGAKNTYKKKNTESNIINQTFSFLSSEKSKKYVLRLLSHNESKVREFYQVMERVKKSCKKYINRKYIKELLAFQEGTAFLRVYAKAKVNTLTVEEIRKTLRSLTRCFLSNEITLSLLTSSKIYKETLPQHFWRKREIIRFLFEEQE